MDTFVKNTRTLLTFVGARLNRRMTFLSEVPAPGSFLFLPDIFGNTPIGPAVGIER